MSYRPSRILSAVIITLGFSALANAQSSDELAKYFGFAGVEIIKIDTKAGPMLVTDLNDDDLNDLIVVNNFKSRIETHYQRPDAKPGDKMTTFRVNDLPEHWRFRREFISVSHRVMAVVAHDFDDDGLMDLIYAGDPATIAFVRQTEPGKFEITRKHRVRDLSANRDGLAVADITGDQRTELIALVDGEIHIWPLDGDSLGQPIELSAGETIVACLIEDYNGDDRLDIAGIIPEDAAPIRIWLSDEDKSGGVIGPQLRFEMPSLREASPVSLPDTPETAIAVIERASKRLVLYRLESETVKDVEQGGDHEASMQVHGFTDSGNRKRDVAVFDVNGDGLLDLVATDTSANTVVVYRQAKDKGLQPGESYPSYSDLDYLAAGNVDDDDFAELFVLSEEESAVGRSEFSEDGLDFPRSMTVADGRTPVAMNLVQLQDGARAAVIARKGRSYVIELMDMAGESVTIALGSQSRAPETILSLDADQDGLIDLLLLTRAKPMIMLRNSGSGFEVVESDEMGQFGLVKEASSENTAAYDIDGDDKEELLIADDNYVRAVRYETDPQGTAGEGWQVVRQLNANDGSSDLVSIAILGKRIVTADTENQRLVIFGQGESGWRESESLNISGFEFESIYAGAFSGDEQENILAVGDDGFGVIRLSGDRAVLKQFAAWRNEKKRRLEHELASGDLNSDGFTDLVALDAGEQMCEIFTFTETHEMLYATGFQVFESKLFTGGDAREFEPSAALIEDLTADNANDLLLLTHDRILLYPQMTEPAP